MGHFPWTAISLNMTDSYHPSTRAAGCVQVNQVIQVAVMQQQAMTAKNSAASKGDNGVHILQAQVIENALETWKYEVQILKYPQITILETQFLASFKKGSGNTGEPCARWKSCFTKTCCTSSHQNHQCPNGNSSINRWFYMIFTYFPIKSTKKNMSIPSFPHDSPWFSYPLMFPSVSHVNAHFLRETTVPGAGSKVPGFTFGLRRWARETICGEVEYKTTGVLSYIAKAKKKHNFPRNDEGLTWIDHPRHRFWPLQCAAMG